MTEINIGGRVVPLLYTAFEMIAIQKEIGCTAFQLKDKVFGIHLEDEDDPDSLRVEVARDAERTKNMCKLIRILGNAGLEEKGEKADLTDKWVMRNMKPAMIVPYAVTVMAEIAEGNRMESPNTEQQGPVDEVLEEQMAKKQPGN